MIETDRLIAPQANGPREDVMDRAIRPRTLDEYIGQQVVKEQMTIFLQAARGRGEPLDHTLIFGPPGLGKTTLASIIAHEMGVSLKTTSGPVLEKAGDIAALMTNLEPGDVLFIDEIHRLSPLVEEILYPAMEDYQLDIMIGEGPGARSIKLDLPPFTLVGATTRAGLLTSPAAGPVWHRTAPGILRGGGSRPYRRALGAYPEDRYRCPWRGGDRAPRARHAAHRQPPAAPGARLRRGQGRRAYHQRRSPIAPWTC